MLKSSQPLATIDTTKRVLSFLVDTALFVALICSVPGAPRAQSATSTTWTVTIVLPARLVAGRPATFAVLGVDGKLAPDVTVDIGNDQRLTTDQTGRATFTAPASRDILLAKASGTSAAALVDAPAREKAQGAVSISPAVSLREPFSICGAGLQGNADANRALINGDPALVMAASPECLSILPGSKSQAGPAQVAIQTPGGRWTAATTFISLEPEFPNPPLLPGNKGRIAVRVRGSDQKLRILVVNQTPGMVRFSGGDTQELVSGGGSVNSVEVEAQAIRSGDFSFDARLLPPPDADAAHRYLEAASPLAPAGLHGEINRLSKRFAQRPRDLDDVRRQLDRILAATVAGDFRTLLAAARLSL